MDPASITPTDLWLALPEIWLMSAACVILLIDLVIDDRRRWVTFLLSLVPDRRRNEVAPATAAAPGPVAPTEVAGAVAPQARKAAERGSRS